MISDNEGQRLVCLAREAVAKYLSGASFEGPTDIPSQRLGVFVTLNKLSETEEESLRGCIGYLIPDRPLQDSVVSAAIAAATEDPRFEAVTPDELQKILFEVSILTPLEEIITELGVDRRNQVRIGVDGLVINFRQMAGLLLPQVATELGWSVNDFLAGVCHKAGLSSDKWMDPAAKLYRFQSIIYKEKYPCGPAVRISISD